MAFTLKITPKGLFKKKLDFEKLVNSCGMAYGHMNDFYILDDGMENSAAVIYNPKRIGRGIAFDGSNPNELGLRYNIPTTEAETCESVFPIKYDDFVNMGQLKISEGFVRYALISGDKILDKLFDYDRFIKYHLEHGAEYFDKKHIIIPPLNYEQMFELVQETAANE